LSSKNFFIKNKFEVKMIHELFPQKLLQLLTDLHYEFDGERQALLHARRQRQSRYDQGTLPDFEEGHPAKSESWKVAPIPPDLLDRRVEITGPVSNAKMVINMLSANHEGELACTAMLDFEDSMGPTWENVTQGFANVIGVAHGDLSYMQPQANGHPSKVYKLNPQKMAHPMVRVRGLHLNESHYLIESTPIAAGLFDLAVTSFHTASVFLRQGKTPKFYVPKCEHYLEARWWNRLFQRLEDYLLLDPGTLRVTFLIETLPAAFQMEEILYEIRERACGLNGGRWDKIFSDIKTLRLHKDRILADRSAIDMRQSWMDQYAKLLIKTCHKHGAFAMGGMSAFTPGKDEETRRLQSEKVIADKKREAQIGHDGCWVSHPYFIGLAKKQFPSPNQLSLQLKDFSDKPDLLPRSVGPKTLAGLRQNIRVGIIYQQSWDQGVGCVAYENLMEDLATLEISRAQSWQWLYHRVRLDDGGEVNPELVHKVFDEEAEKILEDLQPLSNSERESFLTAKNKIREVYLQKDLREFFTSP
jgi:malate synthase